MDGSAQLPTSEQPEPEHADLRPVSVTAAAGILLAVGIFGGLIGLVLLIVAAVSLNPAQPSFVQAVPDGFAGVAGAIGLALVAYGVVESLAAIQVLRRRSWARGLGIVLAAVGVAALVIALIRPGQTNGTTPLIFAPVMAALVYAAVALATEGGWFEGPGPARRTR